MKAIKFFTGLATLTLALTLSLHVLGQEVNTKNSSVKWTAEKVTGSHTGFVSIQSGNLQVKDNKISGGTIVMDMNSITCTDLEDPGYNAKLIGHLKSDDFFGVANNPTAKFTIEKVINQGKKTQLVGKLTIKGITKDYEFEVMEGSKNGKYMASGTMTINRTDFGIKYGSGSFFDGLGDKMIYDEFTLEFTIETK